MDVKARIRELMDDRNRSEYRLAIEAGLSQSTVANIFNRNTTPSVATIEAIYGAFGISLAQFFAEDAVVEPSDDQRDMFSAWSTLTKSISALATSRALRDFDLCGVALISILFEIKKALFLTSFAHPSCICSDAHA